MSAQSQISDIKLFQNVHTVTSRIWKYPRRKRIISSLRALLYSAVLFCVIVLFAFRRAFTLAFNSGFILPEFYKIALVAILSLLATVVSSLISAALGIKKVSRMDAGLVLKEGE